MQRKFKFQYLAAIGQMKVHTVYGNTDPIEGRGQEIVLATFDEAVAANEFAKAKGVYRKPVEETIDVIVPLKTDPPNSAEYFPAKDSDFRWDTACTLRNNLGGITWSNPNQVRARIMEKLTPEERDFLAIHGISADPDDDDK